METNKTLNLERSSSFRFTHSAQPQQHRKWSGDDEDIHENGRVPYGSVARLAAAKGEMGTLAKNWSTEETRKEQSFTELHPFYWYMQVHKHWTVHEQWNKECETWVSQSEVSIVKKSMNSKTLWKHVIVSCCSDAMNEPKKVVRKMFSVNKRGKNERLNMKKHSSIRNISSTNFTNYRGKSTSQKGSDLIDHLTFGRCNHHIKMKGRASSTMKPVPHAVIPVMGTGVFQRAISFLYPIEGLKLTHSPKIQAAAKQMRDKMYLFIACVAKVALSFVASWHDGLRILFNIEMKSDPSKALSWVDRTQLSKFWWWLNNKIPKPCSLVLIYTEPSIVECIHNNHQGAFSSVFGLDGP